MSKAKGMATGQGLHFGGEKAQKMDKRLRAFAEENKRRVPCKICGNIVLPEKMAVHVRAFHED